VRSQRLLFLRRSNSIFLFQFSESHYHLNSLIFIRSTDNTNITRHTVGLLVMRISCLTPSLTATRRIAKQVLTTEAAGERCLLSRVRHLFLYWIHKKNGRQFLPGGSISVFFVQFRKPETWPIENNCLLLDTSIMGTINMPTIDISIRFHVTNFHTIQSDPVCCSPSRITKISPLSILLI